MACKDCKKVWGRCDSCYYVDGDEKFKQVTECLECNANICDDCMNNWPKRGIAYFARKAEKLKKFLLG